MADPWMMSGLLLAGITAVLLLVYSYANPPPSAVSAETARTLLHDGYIQEIVDVRRPDEFGQGHLREARNIPLSTLVTRLPQVIPGRRRALLIYCASGRRAAKAATIAQDLGYSNVRYVVGDYQDLEERRRLVDL
jgi:rhodanese-related sulfurtransferase